MPDLPTFDELYAAGQTEMQSRNPRLTDFNEGSNADAILGMAAALADEVIGVVVDLFAALFVDTATASELDALASDRFGLTRKAAAAAVGEVTFTRSATTPTGAILIPAGTTIEAEVDGEAVQFTTDAGATIPDGSNTVDVAATCTATGTSGNVAAGVVDDVIDVVTDDPDITVENADRFTGGASAETDDAFRDRVRAYFSTLRRGTVDALQEGALSVPGVSFATVDESFILPDDGGYVAVYIGDPDARANATLVALVATELEDWRAAGVQVQVSACDREEIPLSMTVSVERGADQVTIREDLVANVLAYVNALDPGVTMRLSRVQAAAIHVSPQIVDVAISSPATDHEPTAGNLAVRVNEGDLTVLFVEV